MSYDPPFEASKALPVKHIAKQLEEFVATGQDLSKRRFSRSPPRVPSVPSTEWEDSEPPSPRAQLADKETKELRNSTAGVQFRIQVEDELNRMQTARDKGLLLQQCSLSEWEDSAEANVKYRWIQQGIWDEQWASKFEKTWKHEVRNDSPLVEPTKSVEVDVGTRPNELSKRKRQRSDLEEYNESVRCAIDFQDQQSSRPCYQFVYQFCKEREWIKMGLGKQELDQLTNLDTRAYEDVKARWIRDGLWDDDWTFIPGTTWRHERPQKYRCRYEFHRRENAVKATEAEKAERPPRWYFMAPIEPPVVFKQVYSPPPPFETGYVSSDLLSHQQPVTQDVPSLQEKYPAAEAHNKRIVQPSRRKSAAKAKTDTSVEISGIYEVNSTAQNPTKTQSDPMKSQVKDKEPPKHKLNTRKTTPTKPVSTKKGISTSKSASHPQKPSSMEKVPAPNAAASRPRRAAATKAMLKLAKAGKR